MSADNTDDKATESIKHPLKMQQPPDWDDWPDKDQIQHITGSFNRGGLVREVLLLSGVDVSDRNIDSDTQLRKDDLAAVYAALGGLTDDD